MVKSRAKTAARAGVIFVAAIIGATLMWQATVAPADSSAPTQAVTAPSYSIFQRATTRFNAATAGWAHPSIDAQIGLRLDEAQVIGRDRTRTVAVVPAASGPCIVTRFADGSQAMGCGGRSGEPPTAVSYSGAIGLVPDTVQSVTLTMTDGTTHHVPAKNNVWTAPGGAARAAYALGDRVVVVDLMPHSSMPPGETTNPTQAPSSGPDSAG